MKRSRPGYRRVCRAAACLVTALGIATLYLVQAAVPLAQQVELPGESNQTRPAGQIIRVGREDSLQQALNQAQPGDTIELQAGAEYYGPFVLRHHGGYEWVTIISRGSSQQTLPEPGVRVSPADAGAMAALIATSSAVITTEPGAARYHFIGVEIRPGNRGNVANHTAGTRRTITNLVELSAGDNALEEMPHHIVFERSYLHGDPILGTRRGIVMNGAHMAVIDSHLSGFMSQEDAQAVAGWEGTGPFLIRNNYLEASGENLMFGGADPAIEERIPSDITISGNHFSKPLTWRQTHPSYDGSTWSIKNLLELKNAQRVRIDGNLFEHNWPQSQNGFAILFTVRNQDGNASWSQVSDVEFSNNIVRHVGSGINILGHDDNHVSAQARQLTITNNLFYDIGNQWGAGQLLQLLNEPADIILSHNTAIQSDSIIRLDGKPIAGMQILNNIFMHNRTGISGTDTAPGIQSLDAYTQAPLVVTGNILIGVDLPPYPAGIRSVRDFETIGFVNPDQGDFRRQHAQERLTDDTRIEPGVDFSRLCAAMSATDRPAYCP